MSYALYRAERPDQPYSDWRFQPTTARCDWLKTTADSTGRCIEEATSDNKVVRSSEPTSQGQWLGQGNCLECLLKADWNQSVPPAERLGSLNPIFASDDGEGVHAEAWSRMHAENLISYRNGFKKVEGISGSLRYQ
jgi:hypothetical protein